MNCIDNVAQECFFLKAETVRFSGLTIDCQRNRVFWSDYYGQKIKSATFKGKNVLTVVQGSKYILEDR